MYAHIHLHIHTHGPRFESVCVWGKRHGKRMMREEKEGHDALAHSLRYWDIAHACAHEKRPQAKLTGALIKSVGFRIDKKKKRQLNIKQKEQTRRKKKKRESIKVLNSSFASSRNVKQENKQAKTKEETTLWWISWQSWTHYCYKVRKRTTRKTRTERGKRKKKKESGLNVDIA